MSKFDGLKKEHEEVEIPEELSARVNESLREAKRQRKNRPVLRNLLLSAAAAAALFAGSVNLSPSLAEAMAKVPGLSSIVEVLTVYEVSLNEKTYNAEVKTPGISGLVDKKLETELNTKYTAENKERYAEFQKEIEELEKAGGGHLGMDAGYEVMTDNDRILSIMRYEVNTAASSSTVTSYDTIDKVDSVLITLPSLFKDDSYVDAISSYISGEMDRQMAADENIMYFTKESGGEEFQTIQADQQFYITDQGKLVISFDKYEVAPGYMGNVTFEIPTDVVERFLVSDTYIH